MEPLPCELVDASGVVVDCYPTWQTDAPLASAGCQTEATEARAASVQAGGSVQAGVQTDASMIASGGRDVRDEDLMPFLRGALPLVEAALAENLKSTAYDDLDADGHGIGHTAACEHTLEPQGLPEGLVATSVSWNATGYVVAVSYGRFDVAGSGWCTDPGVLATWNLGRRDMNPEVPDVSVHTDNCLQACAFHPRHPALIAGGTFNGELYVWDLGRKGDVQRGRSAVSDTSHREPITAVQWRYEATEAGRRQNQDETYQVITAGADGRVLVWLWHKNSHPVLGLEVTHPLPNTARHVLWGVTALALTTRATRSDATAAKSADYEGAFVVGTEAGAVFRCLLGYNAQKSAAFVAAADTGGATWRSPVRQAYEMHAGPVFGVDTCPHRRGLFLTCGSDGMLRVYSRLSPRPLLELEPSSAALFACQWSPARPCVFATGSADGRVFVYDIASTSMHPSLAIDVSGGEEDPVHALAFNPHLPEYLAACARRRVRVYSLAARLHTRRAREGAVLARLADTGLADNDEDAVVAAAAAAEAAAAGGSAAAAGGGDLLGDDGADDDQYYDESFDDDFEDDA